MFELAFVDGRIKTRTPWTVPVSLGGQLLLVGLGILYPLILTDTISGVRLVEKLFTPMAPPSRRVPDAPVIQPTKPATRPFVPGRIMEPGRVPQGVAQIIDPVPEVSAGGGIDPNGVVGGIDLPGGAGNAVIRGLVSGVASAPAPVPRVKDPEPVQKIERVRVGGLIQAPRPLFTPTPLYPRIARQVRITGVVHLETVIGADGLVRSIRLVDGHPLLVQAAVDAVKAWRYTPTLLNGNPVELVMLISVNFTLQ